MSVSHLAQPRTVRQLEFGGEGGIRTHDRAAPITVFETVAFNRARPPLRPLRREMAVPTGFEPAISALTGPRAWPDCTTGPTAQKFTGCRTWIGAETPCVTPPLHAALHHAAGLLTLLSLCPLVPLPDIPLRRLT